MGRGLKINKAQSRPAQSPRFSMIILDSLNSDSHDADQNHMENLKYIYIYVYIYIYIYISLGPTPGIFKATALK